MSSEPSVVGGNYVEYSSNNSGGGWWLSDEDWHKLEAAGWEVQWCKDDPFYTDHPTFLKDGRHLGALASNAKRRGLDLAVAVAEFESITGQDVSNEGCNCCGQPHNFTEYDSDRKYIRSLDIVRNNSWTVS